MKNSRREIYERFNKALYFLYFLMFDVRFSSKLLTFLCRPQIMHDQMKFKVIKVVPTKIESFRRESLEKVILSAHKPLRKDSVVPFKMDSHGSRSSSHTSETGKLSGKFFFFLIKKKKLKRK